MSAPVAEEGDLAELVGLRHKHFILTLKAGAKFESHRGILLHDDLIGKPWGTQVFSHLGAPFFLIQPLLADLLLDLAALDADPLSEGYRFPSGYPGNRPRKKSRRSGNWFRLDDHRGRLRRRAEGHVTTYEVREDMQNLARKNVERVGLGGARGFQAS